MKALFEKSEFKARRKSTRRVMVLAAVFMWLGAGIDVMVYPNYAKQFFLYRAIAAVFLLGGWVLVRSIKRQSVLCVITHVFVLIPVFTIELMIYEARDPASSYYGGVNVVLVGLALLMRWRLRDSIIHASICVASFLTLMYSSGLTYRGGVIPSYFVLVTGVIAVLATYFSSKSRFREFKLLKRIQDANRQLRATDETKTRFFANISHELRTPLTLILGPLENLRIYKRCREDRLIIEHLDMIEDNSMRLLRLINDILDLVKLDSGESPPRPELIDVEGFINGLTINLRPIASLKNINLSSQSKVMDSQSVWLDRDRLEKIILNLAVNAVKFTPPGGSIILGAETKGKKLILTVEDTGEGMDDEALSNVFVRFWQADMSAKRKHRGAGIGLALVKSLIESMNGEISVDSKVAQGTTFTVAIPTPEPKQEAIVESNKKSHDVLEKFNEQAKLRGVIQASGTRLAVSDMKKMGGNASGSSKEVGEQRKCVLVAEDEDAMRAFVVRQLEGYEVIEARNGAEAWTLALERTPDLMILDYMMPEIDGIELTSRLRAEPVTARIPIILVTAQAGEAARLSALDVGVNDFLTKPFSSIELLARVRNLLASIEFEVELAENHVYLEAAYSQLKEQGVMLLQTEKLSSLGRMSAGIVHEINNPLNYTQTALYALKSFEQQIPEAEREDFMDVLGDAKEGVDRVVGIVRGLRSFTRGDNSVKTALFLANVVESARKLSSSAMSGISFEANLSKEWVVEGNEIQLCQLFVNMFQNATRAIQVKKEKGDQDGQVDKPAIVVTAEACDDQHVAVKIWDNGCGISNEDIERIFEPFFTKNDVGEGLGLGLSITYRIINQHGASVEVDSKFGEYTEFTLRFPIKGNENEG